MKGNELTIIGLLLTLIFGIPNLIKIYYKNKHEKWKPKCGDFVERLDFDGSYIIEKIFLDDFQLNITYILNGELKHDDPKPIFCKKAEIFKISKKKAKKICNQKIGTIK